MDDSFGVAIMLPTLVFQAEMSRGMVHEVVGQITSLMAGNESLNSDNQRIASAMELALSSAQDYRAGRTTRDVTVTEIACIFIYAFTVRYELDTLDAVRGIVGTLNDDGVSIVLCYNDADFHLASEQARGDVSDFGDADFDNDFPTPAPTIH